MNKNIMRFIGGILILIMFFSIIFPTVNFAYQETKENNNINNNINNVIDKNENKVEENNSINNNINNEQVNNSIDNNTNNTQVNVNTNTEEEKSNSKDNIEPTDDKQIQQDNSVQVTSIDATSGTSSILAEGIYEIYTATNPNKVIEVYNSSCSNFANIQLWDNLGLQRQKFEISYDVQKSAYIITAVHSDKVFDVYAGQRVNFANIQQYSYNGSIAQQWTIKETGDGYYNIISKDSNKYLDIYAGSTNNGANIQLYEGNGSIAQKFGFKKIDEAKGTQTISDGIYNIKPKIDNNKSLQVEGKSTENNKRIQLANASISKSQNFIIKYLNNGYYSLTIELSNKSLDVPGAEARNGINIQQYTSNNTTAQQWIIKDAGEGYYYIISRCNGLYVDIPAGNASLGINMQLYTGNSSNAQKFKFEEVEELKSDKLNSDGVYYITSALSSNKVLTVSNGEYNNFSNVNLWDKNDKEYQKFELVYDQQLKTYTITALHSNKALDVYGGGQTNGTNVDQYQSNKSIAQQWILKDAGNGYYYIISKCNYLYLDLYAGSTVNGTNIQMYESNNSNAQKFKFIEATTERGTKTIENGTYNIVSKINDNKVLQVANQSVLNGENIQVYDKLKVINQTQSFEIQYLENGYYSIKGKKSGKALEVKNGYSVNGTKIQQNNYGDTTIQQWMIKDAGDGYYYIISRCNGLYVDIPGGSVSNNTEIQVYEGNNSLAQKFKFVEAKQELNRERTLSDGVYNISTALDNNKVLDIAGGDYSNGANVQIWDNSKVQQQKFQLKYNESGKYYEIKSASSGKVLDVYNNGKTDYSNVWQYQSNGSEAQKWILQDAGNGYYYIVAMNSNLYLDVFAGRTSNGTNIQVFEGNERSSQKFKFNKVTMIDDDSYRISIKKNPNMLLDINGGSTSENENVQIWSNSSVNQQIFKIENIDKTYCKIVAKHSNKVLTVQNNNNVVQTTYSGNDNQKWSFEIVENGYYKIKSKSTGLYLDVYANRTENGTNVRVYEENESEAQLFKLNDIIQRHGIDVSEFNGIIDWGEVKRSGQADFAIIRAGYRGYGSGRLVTDAQFVKNVRGAAENGIDIGIYFFTQAVTIQEAVEEANYVLNLVRAYDVKVKYPIVIDTEYSGSTTNGKNDNLGRADNLDIGNRTAVCKAFCDTIRSAGYTPAVYASRNWFYERLNVAGLGDCDIWVAHYTGSASNTTNYRYSYNIWQYTSSGLIPGVRANVDMNISYKIYK